MLILIVAALIQANPPAARPTWTDDAPLTSRQKWTLRRASRLEIAPRQVQGIRHALCGRSDPFVRSAPYRFVYIEHADGAPPEILAENDIPIKSDRFRQLWRDLGCKLKGDGQFEGTHRR
jgi:hypothetical protein